MSEQIKPIAALRKFFSGGERALSLDELKELDQDKRRELAEMAAVELGVELTPPPAKKKDA